MSSVKTIEWTGDRVRIIDQTLLPGEVVYRDIVSPDEMIEAIQTMRIRGAPALGVAGGFGLALAARQITRKGPSPWPSPRGRGDPASDRESFLEQLRPVAARIAQARPTAVNLSWAVERLMQRLEASLYREPEKLTQILLAEAQRLLEEDIEANRTMGRFGAELLPQDGAVLTHCNAGALATAGYGTALGVIRAAREAGKRVRVFVDETRPLLQGARLTAWELQEDGFDVTLITDTMTGHFLHSGAVSCVVVGADRIAANGDVANKIGTYGVAVLAKENGVPFYVAAPVSTIDLSLPSGEKIPIEERRPEEVLTIGGVTIAPAGVRVANPAFDVTPARYVTAIITERGLVRPPYESGLQRLFVE